MLWSHLIHAQLPPSVKYLNWLLSFFYFYFIQEPAGHLNSVKSKVKDVNTAKSS